MTTQHEEDLGRVQEQLRRERDRAAADREHFESEIDAVGRIIKVRRPSIRVFNEAKSVAGKIGLLLHLYSPLVAVADIECPNCSKLALLEGQQMATFATSDFLLLT